MYLRDCAPGDVVEDVFVLTGKQLSATSTGKFFIKAFVSDRTAQVTARMWNATRELFNALPESGFVGIRGRVENYQNNLQLIIEEAWPPKDGDFDSADLLPHTTGDIDQMCQGVFDLCGTIANRHLKALLQAYLDDEAMMTHFCKAPAAMSFHHAFIGGLLEHTLNAMRVADATIPFYPGLSRDLVLAGIFLHDIAKTWELTYESAFGYSDGGQLVGHIVKSALWVEEKAKAAEKVLGEPIPRDLIDVIQHIILSHHGSPEFGAARTPATPEALAVHAIENLDAKLMMALTATRGEPAIGIEGNWTEYMKAFSGRLYRPDVAAAETPPANAQTVNANANAPSANAPTRPPVPAGGQPTAAKSSASAPSAPSNPRPAPAPSVPQAPVDPLKITNPLFESNPPKRK